MSTSGRKVFEWVEKRRLKDYNLDADAEITAFKQNQLGVDDLTPFPPPWTNDYLVDTLKTHGVDTSQSGNGGSCPIAELMKELREGDAVLKFDPRAETDSVIWFASVVTLTIWSAEGEALVQESVNGKLSVKLPEARMMDGKDPTETLEEFLSREMGLHTNAYRIKDCDLAPVAELRRQIHPGLVTLKEVYDATVQLTAKGVKPPPRVKGAVWMPSQAANDVIKDSKAQRAELRGNICSMKTLHPWGPEQLAEICTKHGLTNLITERVGVKGIKTLAEELDQGQCHLMLKRDGSLVRVLHIVTVLLWSNPPTVAPDLKADSNAFLIETSHQVTQNKYDQKKEPKWPGHKCRQGETQAQAADRMLHQVMEFYPSEVEMTRNPVLTYTVAASSGYAGLNTIYHTGRFVFRAISGRLKTAAPSKLLVELDKARAPLTTGR
jgi:hypothetical protein